MQNRDPVEEWESRSQRISDGIGRYLVILNGGGIALTFVEGCYLVPDLPVHWILIPVVFFILGLLLTGVSLHLAKDRVLRRMHALRLNQPDPEFTAWYWQTFIWDLAAFILFALGAIDAISAIAAIEV